MNLYKITIIDNYGNYIYYIQTSEFFNVILDIKNRIKNLYNKKVLIFKLE